jgi:hypothetical protein
VLAQIEIPQGVAHERGGNLDFLDRVAVVEAQLFQQIRPHQLHTEALTHHFRGEDHPISAHPVEHLHVQIAGGAGNHLLHTRPGGVLADQRGGDAGLDRLTDRHHHGGQIEHAGGAQGLLIGAIHHARLNGRIDVAQLIDGALALIDGQDLGAGAQQLGAHRGAEAAHTDHGEASLLGGSLRPPLPPLIHNGPIQVEQF